jgi:hypothetical protein
VIVWRDDEVRLVMVCAATTKDGDGPSDDEHSGTRCMASPGRLANGVEGREDVTEIGASNSGARGRSRAPPRAHRGPSSKTLSCHGARAEDTLAGRVTSLDFLDDGSSAML